MNFDIIEKEGARVISDQLQLFANILSEFAGYETTPLSAPTSAESVSVQLMKVAGKFSIPFSISSDLGTVGANLRNLLVELEKRGILTKDFVKNRALQIYSTVDPKEKELLDLRIP